VTYGIDIGGTKVLGVALGPADTIVAEARLPTPTGTREIVGSHVSAAVAEVVSDLDRELRAGPEDPAPVGVGAPGMVDRRGRLCFAPNLPQAHGADWTELIGSRLPGRVVLIENDANFAVLAEHRLGAARGYGDVVMVTLGTGIGGGIVVDGRVQVGSAGFAGEIGHMVVDPAGPPCPCGRRGCWERFASGAGMAVLAREAALGGRLGEVVRLAGGDPESVRGEDVSAAAAAGDASARRVIEEVGSWIGFGLANLTCVLDPEYFVLGGGLVQAGDLLLDAARRTYAELVEGGDRRPSAAIVPAAFGERSGAVAAGVDGVFCYDHIWPMGQPERPALAPFPVLGALAVRLGPGRGPGEGPFLGTLVARVGLVPNAVLASQFVALDRLAPGRVIAGLGTGDHLSAAENRAYGIPFAPVAERRAELVDLARAVARAGITVWVAGGGAARPEEARDAGAALNVWDAPPSLVAQRAGGLEGLEVTWAGPPPAAAELEGTVRALHDAGATWAVFGWPVDVDELAAVARAAAAS
jgi:glucokinase